MGEALPWERGKYLELFPALRVILLWPDPDRRRPGTWWALPYNESDARQRFGLRGDPVPVFLCDPTNGAERFERVLARVDGRTLWFDGPDPMADPTHAEWLRSAATQDELPERFLSGLSGSERLALLYSQIRRLEVANAAERLRQAQGHLGSLREQQEWLKRVARNDRLEAQLRRALQKADATLHSYSETLSPDGSPGQLVVEWSEQGQTRAYRSVLDPGLTVVSSGICLSGRDREFDLTSLVSVMRGQTSWMEQEE